MKTLLMFIGALLCFNIACDTTTKPKAQSSSKAPNNSTSNGIVIQIQDANGNVALSSPESEGVRLVNDLFEACRPEDPRNSYMTAFVKERIQRVYTGITSGNIQFHAVPYFAQGPDGQPQVATLMSSVYEDIGGRKVPTITLYVPRLLTLTKIQQKVPEGFNDVVKNTFMLSLVHESVHLDQPPEFFDKNDNNPAGHADEEMRAWYIVDANAVRQLRKNGIPLDLDWVLADDILKDCPDYKKCPKFRDFITKGEANTNPRM